MWGLWLHASYWTEAQSTKVVLQSAEVEEGGRQDGDGEHQQEDRRDKIQKYRLDVREISNSRQHLVSCLPLSVWPNNIFRDTNDRCDRFELCSDSCWQCSKDRMSSV